MALITKLSSKFAGAGFPAGGFPGAFPGGFPGAGFQAPGDNKQPFPDDDGLD